MSNNNTVVKQVYVCDGTNTTFAIPFFFLQGEESTIKVYLVDTVTQITTPLVINADYTLNNPATQVTTLLPYDALKLIVVKRVSDKVQKSEFIQGPFPFEAVEEQFDRVVSLIQETGDDAQRAIKASLVDTGINLDLPSVVGNENKVITLNPTADGFTFGPDVASIEGAVQSALDAAQSAADALISETAAALSELNAGVSEQNTTFYANLFLFEEFIPVLDTDSPIATVANGALYLANDTNGNIDFSLPDITSVDDNWKIAVIKQSASLNVLNILPFGADTILNQPTFVATQQGIGIVFFKRAPSDWGARYFAFTESTGINPLPPGGATGAALVKASAADSDAVWEDLVYDGFSSRYNQTVNLAGLKPILDFIFGITYLGPLIASFTGSSNSLREKGATVSGITLTVNVTKRSNNIARIVFKQSGATFEDLNPPGNIGSGSTSSSVAVTPFSNNMTFSVEVTDAVVGADGGSTVTSSTTYSFVYPYYSGASTPGLSAAAVAGLTKIVMNSTATVNRPFTTVNGDVYYFAYPAAYGNLTSILDENGFETFSAWTRSTSNITGLDASAQSYAIYESNNPVTAGSTNFTFKR